MSDPRPALDWGLGNYERTAEQLMPAAEAVVEAGAPAEGERVLDLGCGTGNAAVLAARRGGQVTGVDPAPRLLEVAGERAREAGLEIDFALGDAASIPLADAAADLLLSVFAVIFAPDPEAAAAEMGRVAAPAGRIVLSAWIPDGAISKAARLGREAVDRATGKPPGPAPFSWHEPETLESLLDPHGFSVETTQREIAFRASSPQRFYEDEARDHPIWVAAAAVLPPADLEELERRSSR